MSAASFLPESGVSSGQSLTPAVAADPTDSDIALMQRVLRTAAARPHQIPGEFMAQLIDAIQVSNLIIPVSQLSGFSQFTAQYATVADQSTTTSTAYADLSTGAVGPSLSGLPDGKYVFLFGAAELHNSGTGNGTWMSLQVNSTAASDSDAIQMDDSTSLSLTRAVAKTLSNSGNNTVTAKYRVTAGTGRYHDRWLLALRYANI